MKPTNMIVLMSDEHASNIMGCAGHPFIQTPNLDRLAAQGTRFDSAYTNAPICVPARASFATGKYGHQTGHWDNATPYTGEPKSWGHYLQENGNPVGSIGKLHYRNESDPVGLDFQQIPMHLVNGVGDVLGCVREPLPRRWKARDLADSAGPGETTYTNYDRNITEAACEWIAQRGQEGVPEKPWTVFISMVAPHFPLTAPQQFYDLYKDVDLKPSKPASENDHPWLKALRHCFVYDNFNDERTCAALTGYFGLVSFMDTNVGRILDAVDAAGLTETTRIVYVSDHGDNMGERGMWGKSNMYEEAAAVPMILSGPDVPAGHVCKTPVSLADVFPTVLDCAGLNAKDSELPGRSLIRIAAEADSADRVVFSEYHAAGAASGAFMIRKGKWKYIYYVGMEPQLFDLEADPEEVNDLGTTPTHQAVREELHAELLRICDPVEVDRQAKADQAAIISANGGVEAVLERGGFGATPAPGANADFVASKAEQ
ncbi:sulfatase-like hydrolase/transferase [Ruegeria sp. R14_0]|uniref:sulfatase-like hydrolase/transferase n=1 Tax=Ruegeria sp. R14_0 TaxID=2821100 RepID=UPI001ADBF99A|nr:sulfatase-like hydrolase/transferase [Ruegeria sp. R14_0]MBO9446732.1 sulfatase-like hydrolase/transferase [Ruegeria sp. R14_0]